MGLDMYLSKRTYVKNWDHQPNKHKVTVKLNNKIRKGIGFFFGNTEYDQYYYQECKETAETIRALLKEEEADGVYEGEFYYQASW